MNRSPLLHFASLLPFLLFAAGEAPVALAADDGREFQAPLLENIVIDGDASDWGDNGFRVDIMRFWYVEAAADDFCPTARLAWNDEGLLAFFHVADNDHFEGADTQDRDRVGLTVLAGADRKSNGLKIDICPGLDEGNAEPTVTIDPFCRVPDGLTTPAARAAARRVEGGYVVEALFPWKNIGVTPAEGLTVQVQCQGYDVDSPDANGNSKKYVAGWHARGGNIDPPLSPVTLAHSASAPVRVLVTDENEESKMVKLHLLAAPDQVGKAVVVERNGREYAKGVFEENMGWAKVAILLPPPPAPEEWGEIQVDVEDGDRIPVTLRKIGWSRSQEALFQPLVFNPGSVFTGEEFPTVDFEDPVHMEKSVIGPYTLKTTYYDASHNPVQKAKEPGRYGAVIEVTPEQGDPYRLFPTLYRLPVEQARFWELNCTEAEISLPADWGISTETLALHKDSVKSFVQQALSRAMQREPAAAAFLAGLAETGDTDPVTGLLNNSNDRDRQWWVTQKRKLYGMEQRFPREFTCPRPIEGDAATVLHEGTLQQAGMKPDAVDMIDAACEDWYASTNEAFAICVARHGVIVIHKAYGLRDGEPMTTATRSWMASVTKLLSASLMMMVMDQGLVSSWDDPVSMYLKPMEGAATNKPLTIRHLYSHTCGGFYGAHWGDEFTNLEEMLPRFYQTLEIGKELAYNGVGYAIGGKIVETVSGESLPLFYKRHLLGPLEMENTTVSGTSWDAQSVPLDIAKVGQMLLNGGAYGDMRFFSPELVESARPRKLTSILGPDVTTTWGLGMCPNLDKEPGLSPDTFGHSGASGAYLRIDPEHDLIIALTRNNKGPAYPEHYAKFIQSITGSLAKEGAPAK